LTQWDYQSVTDRQTDTVPVPEPITCYKTDVIPCKKMHTSY